MPTKPNTPKDKKLSPKQKAFVEAYTDPEGGTFLNGVQSYLRSHPDAKYNSALVQAHTDLQKPHIRNAVDQELSKYGFGKSDRLEIVAQIGRGELTYEQEQIDKYGNIRTVQVRPSITERLKAIDQANKMDGTYAEIRVAEDVAKDEARALEKKLLRDVTKSAE